MTIKLTTLLTIIFLSIGTVGHTQDKNTEQILLDHIKKTMVDVNATGSGGATLLHWAARKSYTKIVKYLVENGADTERVDHQGRTPTQLAFESLSPESGRIVKLLRLGGAKQTHKTTDNSQKTSKPNITNKTKHKNTEKNIFANMEKNLEECPNKDSMDELNAQIKIKEIEIASLNKHIEKLSGQIKKTALPAIDSDSKINRLESIDNKPDPLSEKLASVEKKYKRLKSKISSFDFFGLFKVKYMFKTIWPKK
jgi:hypothetical protein